MKKFNKLKVVQMIIFIVAAAVSVIVVLRDSELFQMAGSNAHVRLLCIMLWVMFGLSFVFLFLDFRLDAALRRENEELKYALYGDGQDILDSEMDLEADEDLGMEADEDLGMEADEDLSMKE